MSIPRLQDVLDTVGAACASAINSAGVTYKAVGSAGYPVSTELVKALGQSGYFLQALPIGSPKNATRYDPYDQQVQIKPSVSLLKSITGQTLTFSGTVTAGLNILTFVGNPIRPALYQTVQSDTPSSIATAVAAAVNALALSGVTATPSGASVTFTGSPKLACNIGGTGSVSQEVQRKSLLVQISIYAPTSTIRFAVGDAISKNIGTAKSHHLTLSDGADLYVTYQGERFIDKAQSSYSCLEWHFTYSTEYPDVQTYTAAQIGAGELIRVVNNGAPVTIYNA